MTGNAERQRSSGRGGSTGVAAYVLLGNGVVAYDFLREMSRRGFPPLLVVLNAPQRQRMGEELRSLCHEHGIPAVEWGEEARGRLLAVEDGVNGEVWLVSVYFGHILDGEVLRAVDGRAVNVHPSLLPFCRGTHTNVWSIIESTPAGVTIHGIDQGVDTGPVLVQEEVPVFCSDTAESLYRRLESAATELICRSWPDAVLASWPGRPQGVGGSFHSAADLKAIDEYRLDGRVEAAELFNLLRARSFPPHSGLRVRIGGETVEAVISLRPVSQQ